MLFYRKRFKFVVPAKAGTHAAELHACEFACICVHSRPSELFRTAVRLRGYDDTEVPAAGSKHLPVLSRLKQPTLRGCRHSAYALLTRRWPVTASVTISTSLRSTPWSRKYTASATT